MKTAREIGARYNRCLHLMRLKVLDRRRMKRTDRIAQECFAAWFKLKGIDPHAPAIPDREP